MMKKENYRSIRNILILLAVISLFFINCNDNDCSDQTTPSKLTVKNGELYYKNGGTERIILCGVSRWEALWRETGEHDSAGGWGKYSLAWYENELIESGINYVRHGGIKDTNFLFEHCLRMKRAGIIVEVTAYRAHKDSKGVLVTLSDMGELAKLGNVIFDINNEFLNEPGNVSTATIVARRLKSLGCIISGGAWSGAEGEGQARKFLRDYRGLDIITHHRDWNEQSFNETLSYGKPVLFNEFFAFKSNMSLTKTKNLMKLAFNCGCAGVQYYGFRNSSMFPGLKNDDPFDYRDMLKFAGDYCKKLNSESK